jgi:amino acid permease
LFSNLNPRTLKHEPGTVAGAALLIAGTTVGAGILALPEVTAAAGFVPSVATLTTCCAFSIITGEPRGVDNTSSG